MSDLWLITFQYKTPFKTEVDTRLYDSHPVVVLEAVRAKMFDSDGPTIVPEVTVLSATRVTEGLAVSDLKYVPLTTMPTIAELVERAKPKVRRK